MTPTTIAILALLVAALTMVANVWTTVRSGQWRNTDDGKAVSAKMSAHAERLTVIETTMKSMPSASEIATLTEVSKSNHELLLITRKQLDRVESWLYGEKK